MVELLAPSTWYLIRRQVEEEKTEGGVIRPETARRKLPCGVVVAVGEEIQAKIDAGEIKGPRKGDIVYFPEPASWSVEIKGEELSCVHYQDITAWEAGKEA